MKFNEKLFSLRIGHGLTRKEIAAMLNVTKEQLLDWENGISMPNDLQLGDISNLFKINKTKLKDDNIDIEKELDELDLYEYKRISYNGAKPITGWATIAIITIIILVFLIPMILFQITISKQF